MIPAVLSSDEEVITAIIDKLFEIDDRAIMFDIFERILQQEIFLKTAKAHHLNEILSIVNDSAARLLQIESEEGYSLQNLRVKIKEEVVHLFKQKDIKFVKWTLGDLRLSTDFLKKSESNIPIQGL